MELALFAARDEYLAILGFDVCLTGFPLDLTQFVDLCLLLQLIYVHQVLEWVVGYSALFVDLDRIFAVDKCVLAVGGLQVLQQIPFRALHLVHGLAINLPKFLLFRCFPELGQCPGHFLDLLVLW